MKDYAYKAEVHGTAVAGVIGASINKFGINGVAPESEILALRACRQVSETRPEGECYTSSITKALDISILRKVKIVNMSFGSTSPDNLLIRLIEEGAKRGIMFVAPVGNMPRQKDLTFPASHPDVIAVGGIDDKGNPYPNPEIASKARVSAPATNVFTTIPRNRHNFLSGTSMSSATIAGIFALAIGKNGVMEIDKIPVFNGDICRWVEELLKISICE
ncbi:MAG: S8 family serine peptidase [Candidatus Mariimomonas ferrooxydans]